MVIKDLISHLLDTDFNGFVVVFAVFLLIGLHDSESVGDSPKQFVTLVL